MALPVMNDMEKLKHVLIELCEIPEDQHVTNPLCLLNVVEKHKQPISDDNLFNIISELITAVLI